ncbi:alpha/beta fold hydrolase [Neisseria leonii]|uniref:alpha/beta hydrolase family protein n=1 Tax=Neisseria leonii TaxID=2995413 RepID=UPI00237A2A83|nr:alpha/beta fold hydrolase [Neisseria sp. 3986]MDD9325542.1 alpha/beta fold hydrolase [Neisseria sp. 3986]
MPYEPFTFSCADGYPLAASWHIPGQPPRATVMIAPATGITQRFYRPFAEYLAQNGFAVLTFDNRGIGESLHGRLKGHTASLVDWGRLDMAAALDTLMKRYPALPCHLIGHSAGAQLVGLMDNAHRLASLFAVGCSSGCLANMKGWYGLKARFFMNVFIPLSNVLSGYAQTDKLGMGGPLPKQVAADWRHWCNGRGYAQTDFGSRIRQHQYDTLAVPALWLTATDDDIAVAANVYDMAAVFARLSPDLVFLNPADYGLESIGHMKFFSRSSSVALWPLALEWLNRHSG